MSDLMQDRFEKLDNVCLVLELANRDYLACMGVSNHRIDIAYDEVQEVADLLRQDYGQMARARDAAIKLLTVLWKRSLDRDRARITEVIGLLDGSEEGEDESTE